MSETITIEVAYALPQKQKILVVEVATGTTVQQALEQSGIDAHFEGLDIATVDVGIFGKAAKRSQALREGDRIEIYRPLIADPKEVRKARAAKAKRA